MFSQTLAPAHICICFPLPVPCPVTMALAAQPSARPQAPPCFAAPSFSSLSLGQVDPTTPASLLSSCPCPTRCPLPTTPPPHQAHCRKPAAAPAALAASPAWPDPCTAASCPSLACPTGSGCPAQPPDRSAKQIIAIWFPVGGRAMESLPPPPPTGPLPPPPGLPTPLGDFSTPFSFLPLPAPLVTPLLASGSSHSLRNFPWGPSPSSPPLTQPVPGSPPPRLPGRAAGVGALPPPDSCLGSPLLSPGQIPGPVALGPSSPRDRPPPASFAVVEGSALQ